MQATATKIATLFHSNPALMGQIKEIKGKKSLIELLGKEAKIRKLFLTKKEVSQFIDAGAKGFVQEVPKQKVLGAACFNTSADDDEENGGTSCINSC